MFLIADDEIFLDVEGYEGLYSISNYGRVYSINRNIFLKTGLSTGGYCQTYLSKKGYCRTIPIHVLVGKAFIGKRINGLTYDHIDRDKSNNHSSNLRLATKSQQSINQDLRKDNTLREKYIYTIKKKDGRVYYQIQIKRNKKFIFNKCLNIKKHSLEDAIKVRDDFLKSV